jgi:chromate transporter
VTERFGGDVEPVPLRTALPTWGKVALLSFGGPAGQIAVMHRLIVEERRWVPEERFLHAMSYCMLLPGPEAQQLATYLGWLLHGRSGGLVAGTLFILPGLVSLFALSVLYVELRDTAVVAGVFYGLKPAVMAVVVAALLRIGRRALGTAGRRGIAAAAFVAIFFLGVPFPLIIAAAALTGVVLHRLAPDGERAPGRPTVQPSFGETLGTAAFWLVLWLGPIALLTLPAFDGTVLLDEALFFSKVAVVTFGGAYAVLSYVAQQAVEVHAWLLPGEMLDGLGMAETTPGPLIQVVQFVGFMGAYRNPGAMSPLAAGALGSLVTAWVTFVPCFLFVLVGAPWAEHLRGRKGLESAMTGITAAVVGVILNLAVWFSLHTVFAEVEERRVGPLRLTIPDPSTADVAALALAVAAIVAMIRFRAGMLATLGVSALLGLAITLLRG